ncbi:hypothetical protein Aspvir_001998 [Aspergillus viridinutans]|uniref:SNF2 N-terminal domain-containing protein n=1 Tax=Aspergillus viridinutans TaxID=75553 RepID=A0A9P3C095_ASPVI|nr:uncharacterized protein Aspvir_001998 [Aspergillus viridinutans]GIK06350.1 hypothetical protein Aspvir_001998 [Aspergillus viridinutans]
MTISILLASFLSCNHCVCNVATCNDEDNCAVLKNILCLLTTLQFKSKTTTPSVNVKKNNDQKPVKKTHQSPSQKARSKKSFAEKIEERKAASAAKKDKAPKRPGGASEWKPRNRMNDPVPFFNRLIPSIISDPWSSQRFHLLRWALRTRVTSAFTRLKPWQVTGASWMLRQQRSPVAGGILPDACGTGKTTTTITMLCALIDTRLAELRAQRDVERITARMTPRGPDKRPWEASSSEWPARRKRAKAAIAPITIRVPATGLTPKWPEDQLALGIFEVLVTTSVTS